MTQTQFASESSVDAGTISRRRRSIVEAPWGTAPLEFFWWRSRGSLDIKEARELCKYIQAMPSASDLSIARTVAAATATPHGANKRADAIRKQVPIMRSLVPVLPTLNMLSTALTDVDLDELERLATQAVLAGTGKLLPARGKSLIRLGLAGAYGGLEAVS